MLYERPHPSVEIPRDRVTFGDVISSKTGWVEKLWAYEVWSGDRVMFVCENSADIARIAAVCLMRGICFFPVNPSWPDERLVEAQTLIGPKLTVVDDMLVATGLDAVRWSDFVAADSVEPKHSSDKGSDVPVAGVFTSGSTKSPRVAILSRMNVWQSARNTIGALQLGDVRWLASLPIHHVGGLSLVYRCMLGMGCMLAPKRDESLLDSILERQPTHVSLVATQLYRLLQDEKAADALAQCKAVVMGGGPTPESPVREAVDRGIPVVMSDGMTETAAMICCTRTSDSLERLMSSGKPLVDGTVSISADGEILVRGDQLFLGYLQPEGSLDRPLTENGWFRTGDLGHFDDAGYLHVTGRKDNMFISGGENIQPEEIEQMLRNIEGVEDAIVVAVDDAEWGRRPVAFVRMADGQSLDADALIARLRKLLPGYKVPRTYHPWPADLIQPGLKPARRDFEARAKELATE